MRLRPIRTLSSALEQLKGCRVVGIIQKVSTLWGAGREAAPFTVRVAEDGEVGWNGRCP